MSRIRTYVVGRARGCDILLEDASVSRRHAEIVRLPDGHLYVTDRATTNGTFVLVGDEWRPVRQTFVKPTDSIRFGDCQMTAARLDALCPRDGADASGDEAGPAPAAEDALDPSRGLVRDPETGEVLEKEPPPRPWRKGRK